MVILRLVRDHVIVVVVVMLRPASHQTDSQHDRDNLLCL